jgi:transposase
LQAQTGLMAQNFLSCDREQSLLLPPDLRDWLDEDHLAWFVVEAVGELELESFYAAYRVDGHGRAAHDPQMMVTLLAYAYCVGECSSRGIERRCREDVAFRVICANQVPDHATIAGFRVRHQEALAGLFGQVLGLCAGAGLVRAGLIAVDGSKFQAAASDSAIQTYEEIAAGCWPRRSASMRPEDERYGAARGDELPRPLARREGRRAWLREAKRGLDAGRAARPEPVPQDRQERLEVCRRRLVRRRRVAATGRSSASFAPRGALRAVAAVLAVEALGDLALVRVGIPAGGLYVEFAGLPLLGFCRGDLFLRLGLLAACLGGAFLRLRPHALSLHTRDLCLPPTLLGLRLRALGLDTRHLRLGPDLARSLSLRIEPPGAALPAEQ